MPPINIRVAQNGKPAESTHVSLRFERSGMTMDDYTDARGCARFTVGHGDSGEIYVDGKPSGVWTSASSDEVKLDL